MACKNCCISTLILLPLLFTALLLILTHYSPMTGTFPLTALGLQNGFDIDTLSPELVKGRTYLVTGANAGLGFETSKMLLEKGGKVVLTCRTDEKCQSAVKLMGLSPEQEKNAVVLHPLELSSLSSVKAFIKAYVDSDLKLDVLILNAGVMSTPYELTEDGIELQIAVNHFAHSALALGLVDRLLESEYNPRVVVLSSVAHLNAPAEGVHLSLEKMNDPALYDPSVNYGQSKLANWYFAVELQRRLDAYSTKTVFVNVVHPGFVLTELARHRDMGFLPEIFQRNGDLIKQAMIKYGIAWGPKEGALTQMGVAVDPIIEQQKIKAKYFVPVFREAEIGLSPKAKDFEYAKRVWDFTVEILNQHGFSYTL